MTDSPRCDGCVFWGDEDGVAGSGWRFGRGPDGFRLCNRTVMAWNATEWQEDENGDDVRRLTEKHKDVRMLTQDGSDYHACLYTRTDFYCADFGAKADAATPGTGAAPARPRPPTSELLPK